MGFSEGAARQPTVYAGFRPAYLQAQCLRGFPDYLPANTLLTWASGQAAQNEVMNNFLNHLDKSERDTLRRKRLNGETLTREENIRLVALEGADQMSDGLLEKYRKGGIEALSQKERDDLAIYLGAYQKVEGDQATRNLILNGPNPSYGYPYAGTRQMQAAYMARMRGQKDGSWDKFWFSPGETANHAAYNQARIDSGLFMNTHPNESFLPSQQALSGIFGDIDAIQNSALAAIGYLGATTLNADPLTRSQFTQMLSNLSDVGASFLLPRISLTPGGAFGVTSVGVRKAQAEILEITGKYANRTDIKYHLADEVNANLFSDSYQPPYKSGTRVIEYITKETDQFVRVTPTENAVGVWMMRKEAIYGLSPEEIAKKYSLPTIPKYISDVNIPAGTRIRTGHAASNFDGNYGAIQYQILGRIPKDSFINTRPIK